MLHSPREKFSQSSLASKWKSIIERDETFEEATLAALLEFQRELPLECDPQTSVNSHQRMIGARRFLDILCTIYQPPTEEKTTKPKGLNYTAGV